MSTPYDVDLTNCDREPIHVPGAIQPHGVLLVVAAPDLTIIQASSNVGDHLGVGIEDVLGAPLSAFLDAPSLGVLHAALDVGRWEEVNPMHMKVGARSFDGIVHRHDGATILELEPADSSLWPGMHHPLRRALIGVRSAQTLSDLCQSVAREVRRVTGFDRVMVYRFDLEDNGSVDAEDKDDGLEPYLGLHYPASDIPKQARELYLKNWLRIIPDARYTPASLVPALRPDTKRPLDLSFAVLRSVSPIHLEYMRNMGLHASMSISLVVRNRLWGLIGCVHHRGPRLVPYELRLGCEVLGRLMSLQIAAFEDREATMQREARRGTQVALASAMRTGSGDVLESLLSRPAELLALVNAEGAAIEIGGEVSCCGHAPPPAFVLSLTRWLEQRAEPVTPTAALSALFEPATAVADVASGVMTFELPGRPRRRLLWFRPEIATTVHWGGDPRKPVEADAAMRLHPRRSFELWKEEVRQRSLHWSASDIEAADELRRTALEIDLERQVAREQQAVRARDELVAVVSHDLRNPLGVIEMQTLVLERTTNDGESERLRRVRALENIRLSVARMNTLIRDLLDLAKIEAGRFAIQLRPEDVGELIHEALLILRPLAEAKRITLRDHVHGNARVAADRERMFQVLSNLVGNAIKFTPENGAVELAAERRVEDVLITVADTGPGITADELPHLFDRYWRARRGERDGAGLGLSIARGIVEAHGGRIWVELPPAGGSVFKFTLPI